MYIVLFDKGEPELGRAPPNDVGLICNSVSYVDQKERGRDRFQTRHFYTSAGFRKIADRTGRRKGPVPEYYLPAQKHSPPRTYSFVYVCFGRRHTGWRIR